MEIFSISVWDINKKLEALQKTAIKAIVVSTNDINFQMNKTDKTLTDPKTVISGEYYDFFDVFSKKALNTVAEYSKYDHRIRLLKKYKNLNHSLLCEMLQEQLEFVKKFLEDNLKKRFIEASSLSYSSSILLAKKPRGDIKFHVDYWQLNKITKKYAYSIPLIKKTLIQLKSAKIFLKIDIQQLFHKLKMAAELEDLTTFALRFRAYK